MCPLMGILLKGWFLRYFLFLVVCYCLCCNFCNAQPNDNFPSQLFYDVAPTTAENFRALCTGIINLTCVGNFIIFNFCLLDLSVIPFIIAIFYYHGFLTIKHVLIHAYVLWLHGLLVESGSFSKYCRSDQWVTNSWFPPFLYEIFILCSGEKGISLKTGKPLHYKGSFFHQVIKGSIVQVCCSFYTCI